MDEGSRDGTLGAIGHDEMPGVGEPRAIGLAGRWLEHNRKLSDDLEWLVLPPLLAGQFRVWCRGATPVAYAAWALLDRHAEARLLSGERRLGPADWRGGDRPWLIYLVAPYGGLARFARDLRQDVFAGRDVNVLMDKPGGGPLRAEVWTAVAPARAGHAAESVWPPSR